MGTLASGSSVIKMGYMNMDFVRVRLLCHDRDRGWWYPPCRIDLNRVIGYIFERREHNSRDVHGEEQNVILLRVPVPGPPVLIPDHDRLCSTSLPPFA